MKLIRTQQSKTITFTPRELEMISGGLNMMYNKDAADDNIRAEHLNALEELLDQVKSIVNSNVIFNGDTNE